MIIPLVEDDMALVTGLILFTLEEEGYQVLSAPSRQAKLSAFFRQNFDLVIMDVMLPDSNGF